MYQGLQNMLEHEGDDLEDVYMQPFQISYTDLFGSTITEVILPAVRGTQLIIKGPNLWLPMSISFPNMVTYMVNNNNTEGQIQFLSAR